MANGGTGVGVSADDTLLVGSGTAWVAQTVPNCTTGLGYATATNTFSCPGVGPAHNFLSATHTDTVAASPVRGDLIVANSTPAWTKKAIGTIGQFFTTDGVDPSWSNTIARGTVTTSQPWTFTQTWNAGGVTFAGLVENITSTASAAGSLLLDLQVAAASKFSVDKSGNLIVAGTSLLTGAQTFTGAGTFNGAVITNSTVTLNGTSTPVGRFMVPMGQVGYFDTTGTSITIAGASDGTTNMVVVNPTTTLTNDHEFDNGGGNTGRLRYTGTVTKTFHVALTVSGTPQTANDVFVMGVSKNGGASDCKMLGSASGTQFQALHCMVSLATNDYIELYIGNTTAGRNFTVKSLNLFAMGM
jgi:hypothetical protein